MSVCRINPFYFSLLLTLALCLPVPAQTYRAWVVTYNGAGNGQDLARALSLDGDGNIFVTGSSPAGNGFEDYATAKYSSDGDTLWVKRYNGPGDSADLAAAVACGNNGNIYVTGTSVGGNEFADYATVKYSQAGDSVWVKRFNGPGSFLDEAFCVTAGDSGYVFVSGNSASIASSYDYVTIKYLDSGDTAWVRKYNGPGNAYDEILAQTIDDSGNLYVSGYSVGVSTNGDFATIKYSPSGGTTWVRRYNGPANGTDQANAIAVDDGGNVYVTGYSAGSGSGDDYATIKYNSAGDSLWVRRYNGPGNNIDQANDIAVDMNGNVFVTGHSLGSGGLLDYATIKYSPSGDTLWVRRYNGTANGNDQAHALVLDDSGNVFVTGYSAGSGTFADYVTIKYSPGGDSVWKDIYNGTGNGSDIATDLALDSAGNIYVTGYSAGVGTGSDFATIKYSPCTIFPGDANASGHISLADALHLVNYVFSKPGDWTPVPLCRGDVNASGDITLADIVGLVSFYFGKPESITPIGSGACCAPVP
ncbi:MAG: SBBP repeat-containing protein [candidate division Zixibacteria bacterium]|nr:SBBP repeat-containing protein [candidate division Zixibacteria bacterium]